MSKLVDESSSSEEEEGSSTSMIHLLQEFTHQRDTSTASKVRKRRNQENSCGMLLEHFNSMSEEMFIRSFGVNRHQFWVLCEVMAPKVSMTVKE
jgi:hypothetical protein